MFHEGIQTNKFVLGKLKSRSGQPPLSPDHREKHTWPWALVGLICIRRVD